MTIEGVHNIEEVRDNGYVLNTKSSSYQRLSIDMSASMLTSFQSLAMMDGNNFMTEETTLNTTSYGTAISGNKLQNIDVIFLSITYDPAITGMRSVTEWINNTENTDFKCKILFDASDISQRKKNIQVQSILHTKITYNYKLNIVCDFAITRYIQQSREREIAQWTRLFKYSLLFAVPAFLATMVFPLFNGFEKVFNTEFIQGCSIHDAVLFLLATPIQFGPPGILFYRGAWKSLRAGSANMDVLVALATSISYIFSVYK